MLTEEGEVAWSARHALWGRKAQLWRLSAANDNAGYTDCLLRFQGQIEDEESGLYYNRFHYYDPESGDYCSPDPIGLAGGVRGHGYVHNALRLSDPLGLSSSYLYRGVSAQHPDIENAKRGIVTPGDITNTKKITPELHNTGDVSQDSPYTSWTREPTVAQQFANREGPGGVILRTETGAPPEGATWSWEWSPDEYGESEVLLQGRRDGLDVLDPKAMKPISRISGC